MPMNLTGKSFLTLKDFTPQEIQYLLDLAKDCKQLKRSGVYPERLKHKNIALIFEKSSTRTRCSFTAACIDEGAHPEYLGTDAIQMGAKESIRDTARVMGRIFDRIQFRGYDQKTVEILAQYSGVPVWNGLTDQYHPTQILADFLTIIENFGRLKGIKLVYVGDGRNNVANSLLIGAAKMGMHFVVCSPKQLRPAKELIEYVLEISKETKSVIELEESPEKAVLKADAVYTDVWISMGEEEQRGIRSRIEQLKPYQVNSELMSASRKSETIFLHCLPAHHTNGIHDMEVTEDVFESSQSKVFDQSENRLHTIKSVMVGTL